MGVIYPFHETNCGLRIQGLLRSVLLPYLARATRYGSMGRGVEEKFADD